PILLEAIFAHYRSFGHMVIYWDKIRALIARFGDEMTRPLLLCFTRALVFSSREDEIPEFKDYRPAVEAWNSGGAQDVAQDDFVDMSAKKALDRCVSSSHSDPLTVYNALLKAICWNMLHFEERYGQRTDLPAAHNVNWLDFTHGITFSNAVRKICARYPQFWREGLLQMACFVGRNKNYTDASQDLAAWQVDNAEAFLKEALVKHHDHGIQDYIVACHRLKTITALLEEVQAQPDQSWAETGAAALNRYLNSGFKGKHVLRFAKQALSLVNLED
ncbi:MAG: hypothetical protein R3261_13960, partial [Alphaproteobacteria bacterium]|nr:hypothetical protein [Alphaproteobacteria bacterium]